MKGEYRIVFSDEPSSVVGGTRWTWWSDRYRRRLLLWVGAFVLVLVLNSAAWLVVARRHPASAPAERRDVGAFWRPLSPVAPPLIVVGDSYLLAETDNQKDVKRLVLDPSIQSRDALGGYFTTHPSAFFQLYDLDLHYAPVDAAIAMWNVLPAVRALHRTDDAPRLISSSRLAAPDLDANDIVYVGRLSNLGILAMPLFRASDFRMGQSASELIEGPTNQRYAADAGAGRYQQSRIDYGYIASFPGPSGKRIILVSGLGDLGLQATAAMINDRAQLDALVKRIGAGRPFEALYEVRAMGTIVRDKSLVSAHPLRTSSMWDIRPARP